MRTFLVVALLCFSHLSAMAASAALVIRDDGYYFLSADSTELVKVGHVVDQRTSPDNPKPPEVPDDKPTARATQIGELTRDVGTHEEAVTLAAVTRALADQGVSGRIAWDTAFKLTLNRVSGSVTKQWKDWKVKVDGLADDYSPRFYSDLATGISIAHGLDATAIQDAADGKQDANLNLGREGINLAGIIALIKMILQLLNDLGIFPPAG